MRISDIAQVVTNYGVFSDYASAYPFTEFSSGYRQFRSASFSLLKPMEDGGGIPGDTVQAIIQEADDPVLTDQNLYDGVSTDAFAMLGGTNDEFAFPFTQDIVDYRQPIAAGFWLSRKGSPISVGGGIPPRLIVRLYTDSGSLPGGTISYFFNIGTDDISLTPSLVLFGTRGSQYPVSSGTKYWVVIYGDYVGDANNHIKVHYNSVSGTSPCARFSGGSWGVIPNEDLWRQLYQVTFTDVPGDEMVGGEFDPYVFAVDEPVDPLHAIQTRTLDLEGRKNILRVRYAITGSGSYYILMNTIAGLPKKAPVFDANLQGGILI